MTLTNGTTHPVTAGIRNVRGHKLWVENRSYGFPMCAQPFNEVRMKPQTNTKQSLTSKKATDK